MYYRMVGWIAAALFTSAIAAADDKSVQDAKSFQGTWQAIALEANGQALPADQAQETQIVFEGDLFYAVKPQGPDPKHRFKLDAGKTPNTIDVTLLDGPAKGQVLTGIYSLKEGKLQLCINIFGKDTTQRPARFATQEGDGVVCATLERAAKKK